MKRSGVIAISLLSAAVVSLSAVCLLLFQKNREMRCTLAENAQAAWSELYLLTDQVESLYGKENSFGWGNFSEDVLQVRYDFVKLLAVSVVGPLNDWYWDFGVEYGWLLDFYWKDGAGSRAEELVSGFNEDLQSLCLQALDLPAEELIDLDSPRCRELQAGMDALAKEHWEPLNYFLEVRSSGYVPRPLGE